MPASTASTRLRRGNLLRRDEMPYFNPNGVPYDHVAPSETFEQAVKILDHEGFRTEQRPTPQKLSAATKLGTSAPADGDSIDLVKVVAPVRSCLIFAAQVDGQEVSTVEEITSPDGELSPVQAALRECHGLQCGFCTTGFVMSITALLRDNPNLIEHEIRDGLSSNFCRCTGYQGIINAVHRAAEITSDPVAVD